MKLLWEDCKEEHSENPEKMVEKVLHSRAETKDWKFGVHRQEQSYQEGQYSWQSPFVLLC